MLYEKYSTVFTFDPPTQNSLYIYIYVCSLLAVVVNQKGSKQLINQYSWNVFKYKDLHTLMQMVSKHNRYTFDLKSGCSMLTYTINIGNTWDLLRKPKVTLSIIHLQFFLLAWPQHVMYLQNYCGHSFGTGGGSGIRVGLGNITIIS